MRKVAIVYHNFPSYRRGVIKELLDDDEVEFFFFASSSSIYPGIKLHCFGGDTRFTEIKCKRIGRIFWLYSLVSALRRQQFDDVICLGIPYFLTAWTLPFYCRRRKIGLYFWTHGWGSLRKYSSVDMIRDFFYRRTDGLLLYGERAKKIGIARKYDSSKLHVVYNSLENSEISKLCENRDAKNVDEIASHNVVNIVAISRMIEKTKFEELLYSVFRIQENSEYQFNIVLIGDGPLIAKLKTITKDLSLRVTFTGAVYDEAEISKYFIGADLCVYPGNIGLSAIHSLYYGVPVVTHNQVQIHGPEVEAIEHGSSGVLYEPGEIDGGIISCLNLIAQGKITSDKCFSAGEVYTPANQVLQIKKALVGSEAS